MNQGETLKIFLSRVEGSSYAKCVPCDITSSIRHGGANDVLKHFTSQNHSQAISLISSTNTLASLGFVNCNEALKERQRENEFQNQVVRAETLFVQFVAEHNLSFRIGDHFTKLVKKMFPDSVIAKYFQCSRTKTSVFNPLW